MEMVVERQYNAGRGVFKVFIAFSLSKRIKAGSFGVLCRKKHLNFQSINNELNLILC